MHLAVAKPEPTIVLRLERCNDTVMLLADLNGAEQAVMQFFVSGTPSQGDPLGQRNEVLRVRTLQLRDDFPANINGHGHIEVGMKE